jgi:hypothetical protein
MPSVGRQDSLPARDPGCYFLGGRGTNRLVRRL